jgi:hypothetical protein
MSSPDRLAQPWAPRWLRRVSVALALAFLSLVWLDAVGAGTSRALPLSVRPFVQVAQLFPTAAENIIEWRILGFRCATGKFEELDVRPFFPIHADDKESRFERALFFYMKTPLVLAALDEYVTRRQAELGSDQRIGGIMILSLRIPIPPLGTVDERYQRRPLDSYSQEWRHYWYTTARADRSRRCAAAP